MTDISHMILYLIILESDMGLRPGVVVNLAYLDLPPLTLKSMLRKMVIMALTSTGCSTHLIKFWLEMVNRK